MVLSIPCIASTYLYKNFGSLLFLRHVLPRPLAVDTDWDDPELEEKNQHFHGCPRLRSLHLCSPNITVKALEEIIARMPTLEVLGIPRCFNEDLQADGEHIMAAVGDLSALRELDVRYCRWLTEVSILKLLGDWSDTEEDKTPSRRTNPRLETLRLPTSLATPNVMKAAGKRDPKVRIITPSVNGDPEKSNRGRDIRFS